MTPKRSSFLIFVALLSVCLLSGLASAQCQTEETVLQSLRAGVPDTSVAHRLTDQEAQDYLARYNENQNQSWEADTVLMYSSEARPEVHFQVFMTKGCLIAYGMVERELAERLMSQEIKQLTRI